MDAQPVAIPHELSAPTLSKRVVAVVIVGCTLPSLLIFFGFDFSVRGIALGTEGIAVRDSGQLPLEIERTLRGNFMHTILEWSAFCMAIFTVLLSFAHFHFKRDVVTPIIGMALFAAGCMDGFQALAASRVIEAHVDNRDLIPFTWAISRTFHALILVASVAVLLLRRNGKTYRPTFHFVWIVSLFFALSAYAIVRVCAMSDSLPQTYSPEAIVARPWDLPALALYALGGSIVYPLFHKRDRSYFTQMMWLSAFPLVAMQLHMALGSRAIFDAHFNVAYGLKFVAYAAPCMGLLIDYVRAYREEDRLMMELQRLALVDPLTELLNRRGLQQALSAEIGIQRNRTTGMHAILIDLDDFKRINDTLGHSVGDVVLQEIARRMRSSLRRTDYLGRIGGDEFMVILPGTLIAEAARVADKVRLSIAASPILVSSGESITVTASMGVVGASSETPSIDELISETQYTLKRSKRAGKNRVSCGTGNSDNDRSDERLLPQIQDLLTRSGGIQVVRQPIMRLADEQPIGYELLSRLRIPGFEMPDTFFRVCLEANLLTLIDHHCFRSCIASSADLPPTLRSHINLFPSTLIDIPSDHLIENLTAAPGRAYCIEISERQLIGDPSYLLRSVAAFQSAGMMMAIDDVGFGRSCLESLILLEPDIIKIDKKVVIGISKDRSRVKSLKRLIRLAASLDAEIIAEGVETREDMAIVRDLDVKYAQGYLWGKPA